MSDPQGTQAGTVQYIMNRCLAVNINSTSQEHCISGLRRNGSAHQYIAASQNRVFHVNVITCLYVYMFTCFAAKWISDSWHCGQLHQLLIALWRISSLAHGIVEKSITTRRHSGSMSRNVVDLRMPGSMECSDSVMHSAAMFQTLRPNASLNQNIAAECITESLAPAETVVNISASRHHKITIFI